MENTTLPLWSKFLFVTFVGCLAIEICYSNEPLNIANDVLEIGMNPNLVVKNHSKLLALGNCPHEKTSSLVPPAPKDETVKKEKAEITKIGCTRKFLEKSGNMYADFKAYMVKLCKEESQYVSQPFEMGTVYDDERRYVYACVAEMQCYEFKKGEWSTGPMLFSFIAHQGIKGPLKP